jgi:hypothetical protein
LASAALVSAFLREVAARVVVSILMRTWPLTPAMSEINGSKFGCLLVYTTDTQGGNSGCPGFRAASRISCSVVVKVPLFPSALRVSLYDPRLGFSVGMPSKRPGTSTTDGALGAGNCRSGPMYPPGRNGLRGAGRSSSSGGNGCSSSPRRD